MCVTSPGVVIRIAQLFCPSDSSEVAYELVKLRDTQRKCSRKAGTALSQGPVKIPRNLASGCGFKTWVWVMPQTSTKWANPQISHIELLLKIRVLTLPDARKIYFSATQGLPQINSQTPERNSEGSGLMHLLDSHVDIFALSFLSPLKSHSHISEGYCNKIFIYCVFKLLLWGDSNNKNTAFLLVFFSVALLD